MIRDYLAEVTGEPSPRELLADLEALWGNSSGDSRGWRFSREELHDGQTFEGLRVVNPFREADEAEPA